MIETNLIRAVEDKVIEVMILAQKQFKFVFDIPEISYEINSSRIAGMAFQRQWAIKINSSYLKAHTDHIINTTIAHEIAHLIQFKLFPTAKQAHGPEFRYICRMLGIDGKTYHTMPRMNVVNHVYICNCRKHFVSNIVHRRMQAGQNRICRDCKKVIVYLNTR